MRFDGAGFGTVMRKFVGNLGPAPRRAFVTGLALRFANRAKFTEPNQAQDAPRDQRHAHLAQCNGSAAEIAPCPLSLVVGVEFPENRFDSVRVAPCFFVEPGLDEFLLGIPDRNSASSRRT